METTLARTYICNTEKELDAIAVSVLKNLNGKKIITLQGELGAGKTTLIKAFCRQLQVVDQPASPTFAMLYEYITAGGDPVYHFDCYRLRTETEAFDLGYEQYFFSGNYCFIEWPEKISNLIPADAARIEMEVNGQQRILKFTA